MKIKTTTRTERKGEAYFSEHDLMVLISRFLGGNAPEITIDNLDWDISQGILMKGVTVTWAEQDGPSETEKEL